MQVKQLLCIPVHGTGLGKGGDGNGADSSGNVTHILPETSISSSVKWYNNSTYLTDVWGIEYMVQLSVFSGIW